MSTKLTDIEIHNLEGSVSNFLKTEPSITNRGLRQLTGINYDQAIYFFNSMVATGKLVRYGKASGIKYVPPEE